MTRTRTGTRRRTAPAAAALALPALLLTGCGFQGAQSFPLPGGEGTGDDAYEVTLEFSDVLDLVPQSSVKVDDVTVGSVKDIELRDSDQVAVVTVTVRDDVALPANTVGSLRQTSLLGEKFVSLDAPPEDVAQGDLRDDPYIPIGETTRNAEIEEVLSALSLVLNGGSLEQLQVINRELINALDGREAEVKDLLRQLEAFVGGLDDQKADIVRALDSLDRLTARLAAQRGVLATALEDLPDGARILADQRESLTEVLTGLDRLGDVSVRVIQASQQNTVADLEALQPILAGLNQAGTALPNALELLATYPFPRTVDTGIRGDYANLFVSVDVNSLIDFALREAQAGAPGGGAPAPPGGGLPAVPGLPELPLPAVPGAPGLPTLPALPGVPQLPGVTSPGTTGSSGLSDLLMGVLR